MKLAARIEGLGLVGPGLAGWEASLPILAGLAPYLSQPTAIPSPEALPATERRRAGKCVRLSLAAGLEAARNAGRAATDMVAIFASSGGDGENCHNICETLASDDRQISPTRFHNSVHNAPAGYWGIATGATHATDCLGAFDASFGAGLVEAMGRIATHPEQPVLLVAYDAPYPEPLAATRPIPDAFALAMVLCAPEIARKGAQVTLAMAPGKTASPASAGLEGLRSAIPAARSLALLELIARGATGTIVVDYLDGLALELVVSA